MSLIEEALRKQREETEKARGGLTVQEPPDAPPPSLPETGEQDDATPAHKALPLLIGVVLGGVLIVAAIVWLLLYGFNMRKSEAPKVAEKSAVVVKPEVANQIATATGVAAVVTASAEVPVVQPVVVLPAVTSAPVVAVEAPVVVIGSAAATTTAVASAALAVQKVAVVVWPRLTVTGLIGSGRAGKNAAIINGQMVTPGAVVEGVKIEAIDRQGVRLSYAGEFRTLAVGGSTE